MNHLEQQLQIYHKGNLVSFIDFETKTYNTINVIIDGIKQTVYLMDLHN